MQNPFFTFEISDPRFENDNLRHITLKSKNLQGRGDITLFIPPNCQNLTDLPLVILLHGVYGSHWAWSLKGGVHNTAAKMIANGEIKPMILAMPSDGLFGDGSGYLPHNEANFEQWIVSDVPKAVQFATDCFTKKSKVFITGLSMGGYGALRLGAKYPNVFSSFGGLSSVTNYKEMGQFLEEYSKHKFEKETTLQENVIEVLLQNRATLPPFIFDCGSEDILIEANKNLHLALKKEGIKHVYNQPSGGHEWPYWEKNIVNHLLFFDKI